VLRLAMSFTDDRTPRVAAALSPAAE